MTNQQWRKLALIIVPVIVAAVAVLAVLVGLDGDDENGAENGVQITARDAWVRATAPAGEDDASASRVTGAFVILENKGDTGDRLVSVAVDAAIASVVELHETTLDANDVMQMRPVDGIDIPAGDLVSLKPGGYHIMLIDVQRDLVPDETVSLTLTFESGLALTVDAPVRELAATDSVGE